MNIKKTYISFGSSNVFNKAFDEFKFKYSMPSINTNLGLLLNDELIDLKLYSYSLICSISIFFLSFFNEILKIWDEYYF